MRPLYKAARQGYSTLVSQNFYLFRTNNSSAQRSGDTSTFYQHQVDSSSQYKGHQKIPEDGIMVTKNMGVYHSTVKADDQIPLSDYHSNLA